MSKRLIFSICTVILAVLFVSCSSSELITVKNENKELQNTVTDSLSRIKQLEETIKEKDAEINRLKSDKDKEIDKLRLEKDSEIFIIKSEMNKRTITFDDQRQVESLIKDYFTAIERKDYAYAWELTSTEQKESYTREMALNEHWGIETLKFISLEGYLPRRISSSGKVLPNTPTVWFNVTFEIEPSPNTAWGPKGKTGRFVDVVKGIDGIWRINGLNTGN